MSLQVPSMQDLLSAGVHFGHQVRRSHPRMNKFIYGAREGVQIIDLEKTEGKLKEAIDFVHNLGKEGKVLLVVGTKKQAKEIVETLSKEINTPFVNDHWIGGLLTNFDQIRKNIKLLKELKAEKEKGELSRYTKREQLLIDRKLQKFEKVYGGVVDLEKIPDAIFVVDSATNDVAVKEANALKIASVGFSDTNFNPDLLDFPIPANDDGIKSIKIITEAIIKAYGDGKKAAGIKAEKEAKKAEEKAKEEATKLDKEVAEEAAEIEEEVEKKVLEESERKV